jgi:uncharacterized alkaline shock family protein YloU
VSPYARIGNASISDDALLAIVRGAVESVEGAFVGTPGRVARVLPGRRSPVEWRIDGAAIRVSVELVAAYGRVLPELAAAVQEAVADALRAMTGLTVRSVDVTVGEVVRR